MPLDSSLSSQFSTPTTDAERRAKLLWYLRNDPETRQQWNFANFKTCAMGLCTRLGFDHYQIGLGSVFDDGGPGNVFDSIFRVSDGKSAVGYGEISAHLVTPDMVADAIEAAAKP